MRLIITILFAALINIANAQNYLKKGNKEFGKNNFTEALINFSKASENDPKEPGIIYNMARCKFELNDYQGCINLSNEAIAMDSSNGAYYFWRAICKNGLQDHQGAIDDYSIAIALDQKDFSYYNRAYAKYLLGNYKGALEDYNKAIELNPKEPDYFYGRGYFNTSLGNYVEAISDYLKSLELKPKDITTSLSLSELYLVTGEYKKAIQCAEMANRYSQNTEDKTLSLFFIYGSATLAKQDTQEVELLLQKKLTEHFSTSWSFAEVEDYLKQGGMSDEDKRHITEIIEKLKTKIAIEK